MGTVVVSRSSGGKRKLTPAGSRGGKQKSTPAAIALSSKAQDAAMMQKLCQMIRVGYRQGLDALSFKPPIQTITIRTKKSTNTTTSTSTTPRQQTQKKRRRRRTWMLLLI